MLHEGTREAFGWRRSPCIKLAPNTRMFERMTDNMGVNCGRILDGRENVEECADQILERMARAGAASELFDAGGAEFAPSIIGATM